MVSGVSSLNGSGDLVSRVIGKVTTEEAQKLETQ